MTHLTMRPLDIDEIWNAEIQLHGLSKADRAYTFFHDETNNIKKLHIDGGRLNVAELKVFVLGGVVHEGPPRTLDISALRRTLRIQSSARKIKLKHVAQGNFLEVLQSNKLRSFLDWLASSDLLIHYHDLDPLFWSTVDIIDSILAGREDLGHLLPLHLQLKSDLVSVLRADLSATIHIFHTYDYPSLSANERTPFIRDLLEVIDRNAHAINNFDYMALKGVIQAGRGLDELCFTQRASLIARNSTVSSASQTVPIGSPPFTRQERGNGDCICTRRGRFSRLSGIAYRREPAIGQGLLLHLQ